MLRIANHLAQPGAAGSKIGFTVCEGTRLPLRLAATVRGMGEYPRHFGFGLKILFLIKRGEYGGYISGRGRSLSRRNGLEFLEYLMNLLLWWLNSKFHKNRNPITCLDYKAFDVKFAL
mgnify:CR=1 FL=1